MRPVGKNLKSVLVITNDSSVFLKKGLATAFEMFGGRIEEIKKLVARLDVAEKDGRKMFDVSYGVISTRFGFVPGNYVITNYENVMSKKEDYEAVQKEKDYLGQLNTLSVFFDRIVICVPKDMFAMMLENETFQQGKVIAVTNPVFEEECLKRNWIYLERKGARLGKENAEKIFSILEKES
ncbi:MAG: hypothetical protein LBU30_03885 [Candidatus Methanoplasma sp.]|jgi:hypothetical protein|nr:hypothetical protein [Candidatus Methanoplasma sp.]